MNHQMLSTTSSTSLKTRFALRFIRSLKRIKAGTPTLRKRGHMIKLVADASMASAVGSKRFWSHALLFKIRNRARLRGLAKAKEKVVIKKKKIKKKNCNERDVSKEIDQELMEGANKLRRVVPGGESMDLFMLLEETAHYMKCLNTQVEVMQSIVDLYSPSS